MLQNNGQSGAKDKIEITPAMVDAGVRYLHASGLVDYPSPADAQVIRGILKRSYILEKCKKKCYRTRDRAAKLRLRRR
jgi:hypothetical protein